MRHIHDNKVLHRWVVGAAGTVEGVQVVCGLNNGVTVARLNVNRVPRVFDLLGLLDLLELFRLFGLVE